MPVANYNSVGKSLLISNPHAETIAPVISAVEVIGKYEVLSCSPVLADRCSYNVLQSSKICYLKAE